MCEASVGWGAGDAPDIGIDLIDSAVPFADEFLKEIDNNFCQLEEIFERAIKSWKNNR